MDPTNEWAGGAPRRSATGVTTVAIEALDDDGRGVGQAGGLELHVAGALPRETVDVHIEHQSPHAPRAWGHLVAIVGPRSPERVAPACPAHGQCGGCALSHLAYPAQLTAKRITVERALAGSGIAVTVEDVVASPRELHYRNKAKYVLGPRPGGGLILGSYAPASHRLVDMAGCQVPEEPIDDVARHLRRLLEAEGMPAYDELTRSGILRYLVIRRNADGELLVVIVAASLHAQAALARVARALRAEVPAVAGVVLHVNDASGGAIFAPDGPSDLPLDGVAALEDRVGDVTLRLSARAFFQINRAQAARLYAEAATLAGTGRVVDLYCGAGGIALTMARRGASVVGIESLGPAVDDARRSAAAAGLDVRFIAGDAGDALPAAARTLGGLDAIVLNPPRKGLAPAVRAAVLRAEPARIIYVSCGPRSLATDVAHLVDGGYAIRSVRPFDLLPGTPHVETLVALHRVANCHTRQNATRTPGRSPRNS